MNKRKYIVPQTEVINVETVEMIAVSMSLYDDIEVQSSKQLGNTRRGEWGNRWSEE